MKFLFLFVVTVYAGNIDKVIDPRDYLHCNKIWNYFVILTVQILYKIVKIKKQSTTMLFPSK